MARMIPAAPDAGAPDSERVVFDLLRRGLPADWVVFHGRRISIPASPGQERFEGEADFVVIDPERGALVLEVKGGQAIGHDHDGWYSIDRGGRKNAIKDPGAQAQRVVHALFRYLRNQPGFPLGPDERRLSWGVVFPGVEVGANLGPGLSRAVVIDRLDLEDLLGSFHRLAEAQQLARRPMPPAVLEFLVDAVHPCFQLVQSFRARMQDQERAFQRLTREQQQVLDYTAPARRVSIRGVAGSGKSVLAIEKARRLAQEGLRVLLLCFNEPLAARMQEDAQGIEAGSFHAWAEARIRAAGMGDRVPDDKTQHYYDHEVPQLLGEALERQPDARWDALVVDEGQDFRPHWWLPTLKALRSPHESVLYVFWDPNQDIYGGGPPDSLGLFPLVLDHNCRNTVAIGRYAAAVLGVEPRFRDGTPEGLPVTEHAVAQDGEIGSYLAAVVELLQTKQGIATERMVLLSTRSLWRSPTLASGSIGPYQLVPLEHGRTGPRQLRSSTVHRFKGLEEDVVLLVRDATDTTDQARRLHHVGASRARHLLVVVHVGAPAS